MSFALGVGADAAAPESTTPTTTPSKTAPAALEPVAIEACDGTRTRTARDPALLACSRWRVDWREQGVVRGLVVADGYDAVIEARERQLAFARDYARFFDAPVDARFTDPGPPVCDTCESSVPKGRWGEGQLLGDGPSVRAVAEARPLVNALASVVEPRLPTLRDVARLAREPSMAKAAKEHAQQTRQALLELSELRLALDEAAVLRSVKIANDVSTASRKRAEALEASSAALLAALGSAVNKAHGGTYVEDGNAGAEAPRLQIELDGASVTATYRVGGASSTWFKGTVALDGAIVGRSLLAPEGGTLTCKAHTEDCGYVYVDATLRFSERSGSDGKTEQVAELWFRRAKWVMAKPFVR